MAKIYPDIFISSINIVLKMHDASKPLLRIYADSVSIVTSSLGGASFH